MTFIDILIREEKKYIRYWPVAAIYVGTLLLAFITAEVFSDHWMMQFMGWLMIAFGLLKLENVRDFAGGFRQYDLFAEKIPAYALIYPFLEVVIGAMYLFGFFIIPITWLTLVIFLSTALGIYAALHQGMEIDCLCLGSRFKLPLSIVAVFESGVMIVMALWMLAM